LALETAYVHLTLAMSRLSLLIALQKTSFMLGLWQCTSFAQVSVFTVIRIVLK